MNKEKHGRKGRGYCTSVERAIFRVSKIMIKENCARGEERCRGRVGEEGGGRAPSIGDEAERPPRAPNQNRQSLIMVCRGKQRDEIRERRGRQPRERYG